MKDALTACPMFIFDSDQDHGQKVSMPSWDAVARHQKEQLVPGDRKPYRQAEIARVPRGHTGRHRRSDLRIGGTLAPVSTHTEVTRSQSRVDPGDAPRLDGGIVVERAHVLLQHKHRS